MSLTQLLRNEETRELVDAHITKPSLTRSLSLQVPPREDINPRLLGVVFDYVFRFGLAEHGGRSIDFDKLVANYAAENPEWARAFPLIEKRADQAKRLLSRHSVSTETGKLSRYVARACYYLGQLEVVFRARLTHHLSDEPSEDELLELEALYDAIPWSSFSWEDHLLLNPSFGAGSRAVGGADADLLLDGGLVEIKTVRTLRLKRRWIRQLVGYALLAHRFGAHSGEKHYGGEIKRVGVYYSRAGELVWFPLRDIITPEGEEAIVEGGLGFVEEAVELEEMFGDE